MEMVITFSVHEEDDDILQRWIQCLQFPSNRYDYDSHIYDQNIIHFLKDNVLWWFRHNKRLVDIVYVSFMELLERQVDALIKRTGLPADNPSSVDK